VAVTTIPAELRERPQWVTWRLEQRDGKTTKVPYDPRSGRRSSSTDPATWTDFETAASAAGGYDGVGYVFAPDDPFAGVDLDGCYDEHGNLHPEAARVALELDSYAERSVGGRGLHVLVRGKLNGRRRRSSKTPWGAEFEVYDRGRYFAITGERLVDVPPSINERQAELAAVVARLLPPAADSEQRAANNGHIRAGDRELLERAFAARNGTDVERLWRGDASAYVSRSEADLALCGALAFWTGPDPERIATLFRQSGLMRDKWNRDDYKTATIERALAGRTEFFDWDRSRASTAAIQSTGGEPTPAARLTELLALASVGLHITGARIVGRGGGASADLYLSDGTEITFEKLRDFAKPQVLRIEVIATTGAKPKLNGERAADALVLLRQVAEHQATATADDHAIDWGLTFLQDADSIEVDINDQGGRWAAFELLGGREPMFAAREAATGYAKACVVIVGTDGTRYVRTGWLRAHVRESDPGISPPEIAQRMVRVGWHLRGSHGRIKASAPMRAASRVWTFYEVSSDWEAQVNAGERSNARETDASRARDVSTPAFTRSPGGKGAQP
jgi:NrS-1  polymerase HBD domain